MTWRLAGNFTSTESGVHVVCQKLKTGSGTPYSVHMFCRRSPGHDFSASSLKFSSHAEAERSV